MQFHQEMHEIYGLQVLFGVKTARAYIIHPRATRDYIIPTAATFPRFPAHHVVIALSDCPTRA